MPALALALSVAAAQPAAAGSLRVSPNQIEAHVVAGSGLPPITLTNTGERALRVDVTARAAKQALSGLPVYDTSARALRVGWRRLALSPRTLVIPGGERRTVSAVVRGHSRHPGRYGVVLFTVRPEGAGRSGVVTAVRLATNVLLRYPGRATTTGVVNAARAEQGTEPRTLRFVGRMQNTGSLHTHARGVLTILDARGRRLVRARLTRGIVLPRAARELDVVVRKVLPAGRYTARMEATVGDTTSRRTLTFDLVGPNLLPTARLEITKLERPAAGANRPYDVTLKVQNVGTAPLRPGASLHVGQVGGAELGRRDVDLPAIPPGAEVERSIEMPPVERGQYELSLRLHDRDRLLDERRVAFDTETTVSWWDRLRDWLAAHVGLVLALAAALILLVGVAAVFVTVRLRRRLRGVTEAPAAAR